MGGLAARLKMEDAIRVREDDPNRCQGITKFGQCSIKAVDGQKFCKIHGGGRTENSTINKELRNYRFARYQDRINHFADNDHVKSLREEIGVLRMVMEEIVNKCSDDADILIYSPKITDLAVKIEKLVSSCHRLESSLGQTLDKTVILNIATRIVNIISNHIPDENLINLIVEDIGNLIKE